MAMKTSSLGMWRVVLSWCLLSNWFATAEGRFLLQRQSQAPPAPAAPPPFGQAPPPLSQAPLPLSQAPPPPPPGTTSLDATSHILLNIQKLHQEADASVAAEGSQVAAIIMRKQNEARAAIEAEVPLAAAGDTVELSKDLAEEDKKLADCIGKSNQKYGESLTILKDKTETALTLSTKRTVRNVEKEAEEGAMYISNHSIEMEAEALALANEGRGAATFSLEAANNTALWVNELPVKDAMAAVAMAKRSEEESIRLRHEYEDVKRMAKLAGNMALNTIKVAKQAVALTKEAQMDALLTIKQAGENALLLNTIRKTTEVASNTALGVTSKMG